jgi:cation diffusion facilitator family transporter
MRKVVRYLAKVAIFVHPINNCQGYYFMDRQKQIDKVTLAGGAVNVILLAFKFIGGVHGRSAAMIADAVHSLSDFVTDLIVLIFVHISGKPQDKSHDYGHGKYETLALTFIGIVLLSVAVGIFHNGAVRIEAWWHGEELQAPGMLALWAALASIVLKELTYRYTIYYARKLESPALEANAWHHRSDSLSSIGTAVGIGGAVLLGDRWAVLDPIASLVVGAFIVKVAVELTVQGMRDLLEHSLPDEIEDEIMRIASSEPDVVEPHDLRTRRIGNRYAIELHILMNGDITLAQAHDHADAIELRLKERFGDGTHVAIHMEPTEKES